MGMWTFNPTTVRYLQFRAGATDRITHQDPRTSAVTINNSQWFAGFVDVQAGFTIMTPTLSTPGEDIRTFRIFNVSTMFTPDTEHVSTAALPGYAEAGLWLNLRVAAFMGRWSALPLVAMTNQRVRYIEWFAPAFWASSPPTDPSAPPQAISSVIILSPPTTDTKVRLSVTAFIESQISVGGWASAEASISAGHLLPQFTVRSISAQSPEGLSDLLEQELGFL